MSSVTASGLDFIRISGLSDYREIWEMQLRLHAEVLAGAPDMVIFTEHKPVITIGKAGGERHLLAVPERLKELGIDLVHTDRGGDITYHGPGQLVVYPIFDLRRRYLDVHRFLRDLEAVAIGVLRKFGVEGYRVEGRTGVWTEKGKIAAIGVHVKKWVTYHGMAFNVTDKALDGFRHIVPCGIADAGVTTLEQFVSGVKWETVVDAMTEKIKRWGV